MIRTFIAALSLLGILSAPAAAAETQSPRPRLKAEAVVTSDIVRIGDLVDNAGIVAQVPIFRAPDLGYSGTVSAEAVIEAVRPHALIGLDTGGIDTVVVTRASRVIEPQAIESAVASALATRFALGPVDDLALTFDRALRPVHVEPDVKGDPRVAHAIYDARSGRFDATVDIPGRGALRLTGRAQQMVEVATLARAVARGEVIKHADVVMQRRPRAELSRDAVTDRDQAVGLAARNALQAGHFLRSIDLMKPEIVQRNETVMLIYEVPGITLTARGKALDSGAEGDTIPVLNEQSRRTIQAVVIGPGRAAIMTGVPKLAANIAPTGTPAPAQ